MKPNALAKVSIKDLKTDAQRFAELGPYARRHGRFPKGTVLPETQVPACPRVKMSDFPKGWFPARLYETNMEHNQLIASCCRHPENHEVEAMKSHPEERVPDIYVFHCTGCGRKHRVFCVGATDDDRPQWGCE
jgi:hypothetical protein